MKPIKTSTMALKILKISLREGLIKILYFGGYIEGQPTHANLLH